MRFKLDENIPSEAHDLLVSLGHDSSSVLRQGLGGATDETLYALCLREERALITLDLDFADIRTYAPAQSPGTIVSRLQQQSRSSVVDALRRVIGLLASEPLTRQLWIVEDARIRIREQEEAQGA
jgi:predicted nuclease of predicted toxin-antitoxin system